jgi:thiamine biosynthesis lipoprotein
MTTMDDVPAVTADWTTWGTYVHLAVDDPAMLEPAKAVATLVLDEVDRACSRFRPDSDLVRANRSPGRWVEVDPLLAAATSVARLAAELTDGLVTPCTGRTLVALGYDRDLEVVREDGTVPRARMPAPTPDAWRDVRVREDAIWVPRGCQLDLGATAKAWAADVLVSTIVDRLGCRVLASLGGDLRVGGGDGPPWLVRVSERREDEQGQLVEVSTGGLATSTTVLRRWNGPDGQVHHLIDPRTNRPVAGPVRTVTAAGASCLAANIASTAAIVLGGRALPWLEEREVSARLVHEGGLVTTTSSWPLDRVPT